MKNTQTTITIHISHNPNNIDYIQKTYSKLQINTKSNPHKTQITTTNKSQLIQFLLDYYYHDDDQITLNHPQISQSDIDSYIRSKMH